MDFAFAAFLRCGQTIYHANLSCVSRRQSVNKKDKQELAQHREFSSFSFSLFATEMLRQTNTCCITFTS